MSASCLILIGKGASIGELDAIRRRYPWHEVWSLNGYWIPGAKRHFDIHWDEQPLNGQACAAALAEGAEVIVSPWRAPKSPLERPFPIEAIHARWGHAYFELTLDYMLALAVEDRLEGRSHFDVIAMPGHDFEDLPHFVVRCGAHYWLGIAQGSGMRLDLSGRSTLLKRAQHIIRRRFPMLADQPHLYGHPRKISGRYITAFGW